MLDVILYSTGCPKCNVLKKKLDSKGIAYFEFSDREKMVAMGFDEVPILEVNGVQMDFTAANAWLNRGGDISAN